MGLFSQQNIKKRKEDLFIPNIKVYIGFVLVEQLQVTNGSTKILSNFYMKTNIFIDLDDYNLACFQNKGPHGTKKNVFCHLYV